MAGLTRALSMKHNPGGDYGPGGPKDPRQGKTYTPMEHIGRDGKPVRKPRRGLLDPSKTENH